MIDDTQPTDPTTPSLGGGRGSGPGTQPVAPLAQPVTAPTPIKAATAPTARPAGPDTRTNVSPYYYRYLVNQEASIRQSAMQASNGQNNGDSDVETWLAAEKGHPLMRVPQPDDDYVNKPGELRGISMAVLQGATFGWGDEAFGAIGGMLTGDGARAGVDEYRREYQAWAGDNGKTNFVAQLVGGLLTGGVAGGAKSISGIAVRGAAAGAVAGAGFADGNLSDRVKGAMFGGAAGLVLAGGGAGIGKFLAPITRPLTTPIMRAVGKALPESVDNFFGLTAGAQAREFAANALQADGKLANPTQLLADADKLRAQGITPTFLDLGGDNTEAMAKSVMGAVSPDKLSTVKGLFQARQAGQSEALVGAVAADAIKPNRFGLANAQEIEDAFHTAGLVESKPYYQTAYQQVVHLDETMQSGFDNAYVRELYNEGAATAATEDLARKLNPESTFHGLSVEPLPSNMDINAALLKRGVPVPKAPVSAPVVLGPSPTSAKYLAGLSPAEQSKVYAAMGIKLNNDIQLPVRGIDYMKQNMDDFFRRKMTSGSDFGQKEASAVRNIVMSFSKEAEKQVPALDLAHTVYGGYAESRNAINAGYAALNKPPGIVGQEIGALSPNGRDAYRIGVAKALNERFSTQQFAGEPTKYFGSNLFSTGPTGAGSIEAQRIQQLFPGAPQAADNFMQKLAGQAVVSRAVGATNLPAHMPAFNFGGDVALAARMNPTMAIGATVRNAAIKGSTKLAQPVNDEVAALLTKGLKSPEELTTLIQSLPYAAKAVVRAAQTSARRANAAGVAVGSFVGDQTH